MRAKVLSLVLVVALATACGARVTKAQVDAAGGAATRSSTVTTEQAASPAEPAGPEAVGGAAQVEPGASPGATVTTAPGADAPVAASGPTDNGGATDVGLTARQLRLGSVTTLS